MRQSQKFHVFFLAYGGAVLLCLALSSSALRAQILEFCEEEPVMDFLQEVAPLLSAPEPQEDPIQRQEMLLPAQPELHGLPEMHGPFPEDFPEVFGDSFEAWAEPVREPRPEDELSGQALADYRARILYEIFLDKYYSEPEGELSEEAREKLGSLILGATEGLIENADEHQLPMAFNSLNLERLSRIIVSLLAEQEDFLKLVLESPKKILEPSTSEPSSEEKNLVLNAQFELTQKLREAGYRWREGTSVPVPTDELARALIETLARDFASSENRKSQLQALVELQKESSEHKDRREWATLVATFGISLRRKQYVPGELALDTRESDLEAAFVAMEGILTQYERWWSQADEGVLSLDELQARMPSRLDRSLLSLLAWRDFESREDLRYFLLVDVLSNLYAPSRGSLPDGESRTNIEWLKEMDSAMTEVGGALQDVFSDEELADYSARIDGMPSVKEGFFENLGSIPRMGELLAFNDAYQTLRRNIQAEVARAQEAAAPPAEEGETAEAHAQRLAELRTEQIQQVLHETFEGFRQEMANRSFVGASLSSLTSLIEERNLNSIQALVFQEMPLDRYQSDMLSGVSTERELRAWAWSRGIELPDRTADFEANRDRYDLIGREDFTRRDRLPGAYQFVSLNGDVQAPRQNPIVDANERFHWQLAARVASPERAAQSNQIHVRDAFILHYSTEELMMLAYIRDLVRELPLQIVDSTGEKRRYTRAELQALVKEVSTFKTLWRSFFRRAPEIRFQDLESFRAHSEQILESIRPIQRLVPGLPLEYLGLGQEEKSAVLALESADLLRPYDVLRPASDHIGQRSLLERLEMEGSPMAYEILLEGDSLFFGASSMEKLEQDLRRLSDRLKQQKHSLVSELTQSLRKAVEEAREKDRGHYEREFAKLRSEVLRLDRELTKQRDLFNQVSAEEVEEREKISARMEDLEYRLELVSLYETNLRQQRDTTEEVFQAALEVDFNQYTLRNLESLAYLVGQDSFGRQRLKWTERFAAPGDVTASDEEIQNRVNRRLPLFQYLAVTDPRSVLIQAQLNHSSRDFAVRYAMHERIFGRSPREDLDRIMHDGALVHLEEHQAVRIQIIQELNNFQTLAKNYSAGSRDESGRLIFHLPNAPQHLQERARQLSRLLDSYAVPASEAHRRRLLADGAEFVLSTRDERPVEEDARSQAEWKIRRDFEQWFDWMGPGFWEALHQGPPRRSGQNDQLIFRHHSMEKEPERLASAAYFAQQMSRAVEQDAFDYELFRRRWFALLEARLEGRSTAQLEQQIRGQIEQSPQLTSKAAGIKFSVQEDLSAVLDFFLRGEKEITHSYIARITEQRDPLRGTHGNYTSSGIGIAGTRTVERRVRRRVPMQEDVGALLASSETLKALRQETQGMDVEERRRFLLQRAQGRPIRAREELVRVATENQWTKRDLEQIVRAEFLSSHQGFDQTGLPEQSPRAREPAPTTPARLASLLPAERAGAHQAIESAQSVMGGILGSQVLTQGELIRYLFEDYSHLPADEADRVRRIEAWIQTGARQRRDYKKPFLQMIGLLPPQYKQNFPRQQRILMEAYEEDFLSRLGSSEWSREADLIENLAKNFFESGQSLLSRPTGSTPRSGLTRGQIRTVIELAQLDPDFRREIIVPAAEGLFNSGELVNDDEAEKIFAMLAQLTRNESWNHLWRNSWSNRQKREVKKDLGYIRKMLSSLYALYTPPSDQIQSGFIDTIAQIAAPSAMRHFMTRAGELAIDAPRSSSSGEAQIPTGREKFLEKRVEYAADFLGLSSEDRARLVQLIGVLGEESIEDWSKILSQLRSTLQEIERDNRRAAHDEHRSSYISRAGTITEFSASTVTPRRVQRELEALATELQRAGLSGDQAEQFVALIHRGSFRDQKRRGRGIPTRDRYDEMANVREQQVQNVFDPAVGLRREYGSWRVGGFARGTWTVEDVLKSRYVDFYQLVRSLDPEEAKKIEDPKNFYEPLNRAFEAGQIDINRFFVILHRLNLVDFQEAEIMALLQGARLDPEERQQAAYWMLDNIQRVSLRLDRSIILEDYVERVVIEGGAEVPSLKEARREDFEALVREYFALLREADEKEYAQLIPEGLCQELQQLAFFCRSDRENFFVEAIVRVNKERKEALGEHRLEDLISRRDELLRELGLSRDWMHLQSSRELGQMFGVFSEEDLDRYDRVFDEHLSERSAEIDRRLAELNESFVRSQGMDGPFWTIDDFTFNRQETTDLLAERERIAEIESVFNRLKKVEELAGQLVGLRERENRVFVREIQAEQGMANFMRDEQVAAWTASQVDTLLSPWYTRHRGFDPPYLNHYYATELEQNLEKVRQQEFRSTLQERQAVMMANQLARQKAFTHFLDRLLDEESFKPRRNASWFEDHQLVLRELYGLDYAGFLEELKDRDPRKRESVLRIAVSLAEKRRRLMQLTASAPASGGEHLMGSQEVDSVRSIIEEHVLSLVSDPEQDLSEIPSADRLADFDVFEAAQETATIRLAKLLSARDPEDSASTLSPRQMAEIVNEHFRLFIFDRNAGRAVNWRESLLLQDGFDPSVENLAQVLRDFGLSEHVIRGTQRVEESGGVEILDAHPFGIDFENQEVTDDSKFEKTRSEILALRDILRESLERSESETYREQLATLYDVARLSAQSFGQMTIYTQDLSSTSRVQQRSRLMRKALTDLYDVKEAHGLSDEQILSAMDRLQASRVAFLNEHFQQLMDEMRRKERVWWRRAIVGTGQAISHFAVGAAEAVVETGFWAVETPLVLFNYYARSGEDFDRFIAWWGDWDGGSARAKQEESFFSRRRYSGWTIDKVEEDGFGSWLGHQVVNAGSVFFIGLKGVKPASSAARTSARTSARAGARGSAASSGSRSTAGSAGDASAQALARTSSGSTQAGTQMTRRQAQDGAERIVLTAEESARRGLRQQAGGLYRSVVDVSTRPVYIFGRPHTSAENQAQQALGYIGRLFRAADPEQAAVTGWRRLGRPLAGTGKFVVTAGTHTAFLLLATGGPTYLAMSPEQREYFLSNFGDHLGETTGLVMALMLFHGRMGRFAAGGPSRIRQTAGLTNRGVSTSFQLFILREAARAGVIYAESELTPIYEAGDFRHSELLESLRPGYDESLLTPEMAEAREKLREHYEKRANFVGQAFLVGYLTTSSNFPQFYQGLLNRAGGVAGRGVDGIGRGIDRVRGREPSSRGESFGKIGEWIYPTPQRVVEEDLVAFLRGMRSEQLQAAAQTLVREKNGMVTRTDIQRIYERANNTLVGYRDLLLEQGMLVRLMRSSGSPAIKEALQRAGIDLGSPRALREMREMVERVFDRVLNETELENFTLRIQSVTETPVRMGVEELQAIFHRAHGDLPRFVETARTQFGTREHRRFDEMSFAEQRAELRRLDAMAESAVSGEHYAFFTSGRPFRAWEQGMRRRLIDREQGRRVERENLPEFAVDLFSNVRAFDTFVGRLLQTPIAERPHHGSLIEAANGQRTDLSALRVGQIGKNQPPGVRDPFSVWTQYQLFGNSSRGEFHGREWVQINGPGRRLEMNSMSAEFRFNGDQIAYMPLSRGGVEFIAQLPPSRLRPQGERIEIRIDKHPGRYDGEVSIRRQDGREYRFNRIEQARDHLREYGIEVRGASSPDAIPAPRNPLVRDAETQTRVETSPRTRPRDILRPELGEGVLEMNYRAKWMHMGREIEGWVRAELFGNNTLLITYPNGVQRVEMSISFKTPPSEAAARTADVPNEAANLGRQIEGRSAEGTVAPRAVDQLARRNPGDLARPAEEARTEYQLSFTLPPQRVGEMRVVDPVDGIVRLVDANGFVTVLNPRSQFVDFFYANHPNNAAAFSFRVEAYQYARIAERAYQMGMTPAELIYQNASAQHWREMGRVYESDPTEITLNLRRPDARTLDEYLRILEISRGTGFETRSAENQLRILEASRNRLLRELDRQMAVEGDTMPTYQKRQLARERFYVQEAYHNLEAYVRSREAQLRPGPWPERPFED